MGYPAGGVSIAKLGDLHLRVGSCHPLCCPPCHTPGLVPREQSVLQLSVPVSTLCVMGKLVSDPSLYQVQWWNFGLNSGFLWERRKRPRSTLPDSRFPLLFAAASNQVDIVRCILATRRTTRRRKQHHVKNETRVTDQPQQKLLCAVLCQKAPTFSLNSLLGQCSRFLRHFFPRAVQVPSLHRTRLKPKKIEN